MASVEMIGLLCAGSTRYHEIGGGGGPGDNLSRAELAGLLAGLGDIAMAMALAKYAGDVDSERKLVAHVRVWAAGVAIRERWQIVKGRPTLSNISALAVFEVVRPNRCAKCSGRGFVVAKVCSCCKGTGYKQLSGRKISEAVSVDECNFRRLWRGRYDQCFMYVQRIDAEVNRVLRIADRDPVLSAVK